MGDRTRIEWADATWNPFRAEVDDIQNDGSGKHRVGWHCEHVSEGCRHCYAEGINRRRGTGREFKPGAWRDPAKEGYHNGDVRTFLDDRTLTQPLRWKKPRRIFVNSMTDTFGRWVPDADLDRLFAVMALARAHTFLVLTKRPERMQDYLLGKDADWAQWNAQRMRDGVDRLTWPLPNIWLGVSAEDQAAADARIPLLGPIDLHRWLRIAWQCSGCRGYFAGAYQRVCPDCGREAYWTGGHAFNGRGLPTDRAFPPQSGIGIDWVIAGGESGPGARPMHPDWVRSLRDQCGAAAVPFFFKQWGEFLLAERLPDDHHFDWGYQDGHLDMIVSDGWDIVYAAGDNAKVEHIWKSYWSSGLGVVARRVGKKRAGAQLDGVEHRAFPA